MLGKSGGIVGLIRRNKVMKYYDFKVKNAKKVLRSPLDDKNDNFLGHFAPDQSMVSKLKNLKKQISWYCYFLKQI